MHTFRAYGRTSVRGVNGWGAPLSFIGRGHTLYYYADLIMKPIGAYGDQLIFMHWGA
jgi:hypothetical protein